MTPALEPRVEIAPGYDVPRLLVGCWQLSDGHGADPSDDPIDRLLELAEAGFDTFDGADIYSGVEATLGRLRERAASMSTRPRIQVHTKLVPDLSELRSMTRDRVRAIVERSLRRLRAERLDLVQFHWWDFSIPGWVETAQWLAELRSEGTVRNVGVTNFDAERLELLLDAGVPVVSNQVQYSLLDRRPAERLDVLAVRRGVHLIAYGALAGGLLTKRWRGRPDPGPNPGNRSLVKYRLVVDEVGGWDRLQRLLDAAADAGADPAAAAVGWTLSRPSVAAVVSGFSRRSTPEACRRLVEPLDGSVLQRLEAARGALSEVPGRVYELERHVGGRHAVIMKTDLHRAGPPPD